MSERFICAIRTLYIMLLYEKWYEAKQIVFHEIDWNMDPLPHGIDSWGVVYQILARKCSEK